MTILEFPPVIEADQDGLLAIGGDLEVESLLLAYRNGIFPWPLDGHTLAWFSPPKRAVLFLTDFHVSRSLKRELRDPNWSFSMNKHFNEVIENCARAKNRKNQRGTWITSQMILAYQDLFKAGHAFSVESHFQGRLVGGVYGTKIDGKFAGESMFYLEPNASKLAFYFLVKSLMDIGVTWIDCQVLNSFTESLGAREINRHEFIALLTQSSIPLATKSEE